MTNVRIIPCLDVTDGRVVNQLVDLKDAGDPVELASKYDQEGADEIALDITASSDRRETVLSLFVGALKKFIPFTIGGGIRSVDDARKFYAGSRKDFCKYCPVERPN